MHCRRSCRHSHGQNVCRARRPRARRQDCLQRTIIDVCDDMDDCVMSYSVRDSEGRSCSGVCASKKPVLTQKSLNCDEQLRLVWSSRFDDYSFSKSAESTLPTRLLRTAHSRYFDHNFSSDRLMTKWPVALFGNSRLAIFDDISFYFRIKFDRTTRMRASPRNERIVRFT